MFSDFQKSEYDHIAQAHFKAIEAISSFFRYYLLVMSLPAPLLAVLFGLSERGTNFEKSALLLLTLTSPILIVVSIAGFCMMMYIINLKMDVVLYSRVVNSIRKYFYDAHDADHSNKLLMRYLPQSAYSPPYRDAPFGFVILTFAIFDALYLCVGGYIIFAWHVKAVSTLGDLVTGTYSMNDRVPFILLFFALVSVHFVAYWTFARFREFSYLRANAIGIDIDGVLNKHRERFCDLVSARLGKSISPNEIRVLPVHENEDLSSPITRSDERKIFNDPSYWLDMDPLEGAADAIRSIKQSYLLPVHIFTHRPWPDALVDGAITGVEACTFRKSWRAAANEVARRAGAKWYTRSWVWLVTLLNYGRSMRYITRYWLRAHGFMFDTLLVERGNENIMYSRGRYENRFNYAKKRRIRFFVEDDWIKALKLSYVCDVVFLIDHPYNRPIWHDASKHWNESIIGKLPANVVRVESWTQLKRTLSQLV